MASPCPGIAARRLFARLLAVCALATSGCSSEDPLSLRLDVPLSGDEQSLIVVLSNSEGSLLNVELRTITDGMIAPLLVPALRTSQLTFSVALYDVPLSELELEEGPYVAPDPATPNRALPLPARSWETSLIGGQSSGWTALGGLGPHLGTLRIPARRECRGLSPTSDQPFALPAEVASAVAVGPGNGEPDDTALLLLTNQTLVALTPTGSASVALALAKVHALYRDSGRNLWLSVSGGEVVRASYMPERRQVTGLLHGFLTARYNGLWIAGPVGRAPAESFFVLAADDAEANAKVRPREGYLERYDVGVPGGAQINFYPESAPPGVVANEGGLAFGGRGEAIALWPYLDRGNVTVVQNNAPRTIEVSEPRAVAYVPQVGPVVGTSSGVFRVVEDRVEALPGGPAEVTSMANRADGFVATSARGLFRYLGGYGYCADAPILPLRPQLVVPVGRDVVVIGVDPAQPSQTFAMWMRSED